MQRAKSLDSTVNYEKVNHYYHLARSAFKITATSNGSWRSAPSVGGR